MTSVFGLRSLLDTIAADLATPPIADQSGAAKVQVAGVSETLAQLVLLRLAWGSSGVNSASPAPAAPPAPPVIVVVPSPKEMTPWLQFLAGAQAPEQPLNAAVLPSFSSYGNDRFINHGLARRQRLYALSLAHSETLNPPVLVTTLQALGQMTLPAAIFNSVQLNLRAGSELDQDQLLAQLEDLGYAQASAVNEEGTYAVRGGIVDVFPVNADDPVRLEFTFDTLASLRAFSAADQKSKTTLASCTIAPAYEALTPQAKRKEQAQALFNLLLEQGIKPADRDGMIAQFQQGLKFAGFDMCAPLFRPESASTLAVLAGSTLLFPNSVERCFEAYVAHSDAVQAAYDADRERSRPTLPPTSHLLPAAALQAALAANGRRVEFGNPYQSPDAKFYRFEGRLTVPGAPVGDSPGAALFDKWVDVCTRTLAQDGGAVAILAPHEEQRERITNLLTHRGFTPRQDSALLTRVVRGDVTESGVYVGKGELASALWSDDQNLLILPDQALFGVRPRKVKPASQKLQNYLNSFADLKTSDLVVHAQHGIGRYVGLTSLTVGGLASDFLMLEYAGGDKVYVPVDRMNLLQRYSTGAEGGGSHAVDKLGGLGWEKRKTRAKGAVRDMADQLLKLHARRSLAQGITYGPPGDDYLRFEAEFPYDETDDQLRAIQDVEVDLRSGKPMDRLVCGDVGFGKTEVAMRAAMLSVLEGQQVIVLVPTTVLCFQHYQSFKARLEPHGVRVGQVNRFVATSDVKESLAALSSGAVDVLIGTHRLLGKELKPKRLGLLVIDEEQRFGVGHKEKLKELKAGAHVLTLTATPIPRTLHMAMVGMRDISVIATPPPERLAVKTYITRFDETLIKEAIEQEVRRGGQVFFIHNRVEDIEQMRLYLKTLVPHVDARVGHGQMAEQQLERVIVDFLEQKFQVLLCTTIIESGIDMPTVNTLIVDRADRFGLAQLYQLRGRVGRSSVQAYAYFLTPAKEQLTDDARRRLDVLAAYQELGAGFQIASHDLELRGAGNLLGGEQSGHATDVGLELYTEMLEGAIHELRGEPVAERVDTEIKLPLSAFIAPAYVPVETQRLQLYKSLFAADAEEDLRSLRQEMLDRFGPLPAEAALLFRVARLKQQLRVLNAVRLTAGKGVFELRCAALRGDQIDRILKVIARAPGKYKLGPDGRLLLYLEFPAKPNLAEQEAMLSALMALLSPLTESLAES